MAFTQSENLAWYQAQSVSSGYQDLDAAKWAYWANVAGYAGPFASIDINALMSQGLTVLGYPVGFGSITDRLQLYEGAREGVAAGIVPNESDTQTDTLFSNQQLTFKTLRGTPIGLLLSITNSQAGGASKK